MSNNDYRTVAMHIRDRIMYSQSFLRLAGKTQVYETNHDDHTRNRLTHSLEVAQIARTIATGINYYLVDFENEKIDIDEVEAIALGHDLGHTPFGHAGERQLNEIMNFKNEDVLENLFPNTKIKKWLFADKEKNIKHKEKDLDLYNHCIELKKKNRGFKHNWQSVRVLCQLSGEYCNGNIFENVGDDTFRKGILMGILWHSKIWEEKQKGNKNTKSIKDFDQQNLSFYLHSLDNRLGTFISRKDAACLTQEFGDKLRVEQEIVAIADEIAQRHHDIEDAIIFGYISVDNCYQMLKGLNIECIDELIDQDVKDKNVFLKQLSRLIVNYFVSSLVENAKEKKKLSKISLLMENNHNIKKVSDYLEKEFSKVILNSQTVCRMDSRGKWIIRKLFQAYSDNPMQLPDNTINAVFREYIRQEYWDITSGDEGNKCLDDYEKLLNKKTGLQLFENVVECGKAFSVVIKDNNFKNSNKYLMKVENLFLEIKEINKKSQKNSISENIIIDNIKFRLCLMRVIADYISGMTDGYAENEYRKLYGVVHYINK